MQVLRILRLGARVTIREIIAEQRRRLRSANPAERLAAALLIPNLLRERLYKLGDLQIGQLLEDEVCPNLSLLAPDATICLAAADRLCRRVSRQPRPNESEGGI